MDFNLRSKTYGQIHFTHAVPAPFEKWIIPGSKTFSAKGKFGSIMLQQLTAGSTNLFHTVCDIREDLALDFTISQPIWATHIAIENANSFEIDEQAFYLKEGQFNMIRSSFCKGTFYMERGNKYRTLSISYPEAQLRKLLPVFPFLKNFVSGTATDKSRLLFNYHHWINSPVIDLADHLLGSLNRGSIHRFYFTVLIKELLFSLLSLEYTETIAGNKTAEAINEAKYMLETSYGKSISLRKIARRVDMDVKELENGLNQWLGD